MTSAQEEFSIRVELAEYATAEDAPLVSYSAGDDSDLLEWAVVGTVTIQAGQSAVLPANGTEDYVWKVFLRLVSAIRDLRAGCETNIEFYDSPVALRLQRTSNAVRVAAYRRHELLGECSVSYELLTDEIARESRRFVDILTAINGELESTFLIEGLERVADTTTNE